MPEITALGWFHTTIGIVALFSGGYALAKYKEITLQTRSGQIYLASTLDHPDPANGSSPTTLCSRSTPRNAKLRSHPVQR
jgi:hypothetical protein